MLRGYQAGRIKMAALGRLGVCRCLQVVRAVHPSFVASNCLSLRNEVLEFASRASPLRLAAYQHRQKGYFCQQKNHAARQLHIKQFSTIAAENDRVLYSLISIKVKGSDEAVLKSYTEFVMTAAAHLKIDISGRIILPTSIQRYTVLKSPHIYKKHRAQYEVRTHARMLQVTNVTGNTADTFLEYIQRNIPEGVSMSVEQTALESFPEFFELPPEAQAFLDEKKEDS